MLKNLALSLILVLAANHISAQDYHRLPAQNYPITAEELPVYNTQISLGAINANADYRVEIAFPELEPLTAAEASLLKKQRYSAGSLPSIEQHVGYSRKAASLDVSFSPIVKRNGKWYRITSCKLVVNETPKAANSVQPLAVSADRYAANSVLSEGRWVKISVDEEGIYQLTAKALKNMGFSNPSRVKIYGYGGRPLPLDFTFTGDDALIDDLCEIATYRRGSDILFFAEGPTRWSWNFSTATWVREQNIYSLHSYYFVTEGDNPLIISQEAGADSGRDSFDYTLGHAIYEKDQFAWYEGGVELYDSYDYIDGNKQSYLMALPYAVEGLRGKVGVAFSASSAVHANTVTTSINDNIIGTLNISAYSTSTSEVARESRGYYLTTALTEKTRFNLELTANTSGHLNYIIANYPRRLSANDVSYAFIPQTAAALNGNTLTGATAALHIADANSATQLWEIGNNPQNTKQIAGTLTDGELEVIVSNNTHRFVIVNTEKTFNAPTVVGQINNQNLHADAAYDMVIITPESGKLDQAAARLAQQHEAEGLRVKQVRANILYNEFSSGTPDAAAYRRYMKMLYDKAENEEDMPKYLLLFGDCNWDNRFLTTSGDPKDYLLAFEISQTDRAANISIGSMEDYATDDYYGILDDGEGSALTTRDKIDIGIGRMMAHDAETANLLVDKTLSYINNEKVGMWKNDIYMLADYGDNNLHMNDSESASNVIASESPNLTIQKVFWDAYKVTSTATGNTFPQVTESLRRNLKRGALIFDYVGHGSPEQISHAKVLQTKDFEAATDGNMPLWIFASCEITPYDQAINDLGRATLYNKNGGTVAMLCANRSVQASYNKPINVEYIRYVLRNDTDGKPNTLGEALRLAKNKIVDNYSDRTKNKLKYTLLGDPAMRLHIPQDGIVLDKINDTDIDAYSYIQLKAGQEVTFSGHIKQIGNLNIDETFNGLLTARLYDREETITCQRNDTKTTRAMTYKTRQNRLYEGDAKVENGRFTITLIIPRDISYSEDAARMVFYAVDDNNTREVNGINEQFYLNGTAYSGEADTEGPEIILSLNGPDFPENGIVGPDPTFMAYLNDLSGINFSGISIGHDIELVIDGNIAAPIVLNDYFNYDFGSATTGIVSYPLTGLAPGWHTLTLRAWDLQDNSSTQTLTFFIMDGVGNKFDVNGIQGGMGESLLFTVSFGENTLGGDLDLEIYDVAGRRVWVNRQNISAGTAYYSAAWNLQDRGNYAAPSGVYIYRALLQTSNGKAKTKAKKILVKRP